MRCALERKEHLNGHDNHDADHCDEAGHRRIHIRPEWWQTWVRQAGISRR